MSAYFLDGYEKDGHEPIADKEPNQKESDTLATQDITVVFLWKVHGIWPS